MSQFTPTQYDADELNRLKRKVDTLSGPDVTNDRDNITIGARATGTHPQTDPERCCATVIAAVPGSQGYYRAQILYGEDPQAGAIAASDLGDPLVTGMEWDCIVANAGEVDGGGPLPTDGSFVAVGFLRGINRLADGGVGTSKDDGLPVLIIPSVGGIQPCLLVVASGNSGGIVSGSATMANYGYDLYAFSDTAYTNKLAANVTLFRNNGRENGVSYGAATNGTCIVSGGTYVLLTANELPAGVLCSGAAVSSG
jgi:hypothetical protein